MKEVGSAAISLVRILKGKHRDSTGMERETGEGDAGWEEEGERGLG